MPLRIENKCDHQQQVVGGCCNKKITVKKNDAYKPYCMEDDGNNRGNGCALNILFAQCLFFLRS